MYNSKLENIPVVIVSFGQDKILYLEMVQILANRSDEMKRSKDKYFSQIIVMNSNRIIILNPLYEKPHFTREPDVFVMYRRGKVIIKY